MADSAHGNVFFKLIFNQNLDATYSVPYNYIKLILALQITFI